MKKTTVRWLDFKEYRTEKRFYALLEKGYTGAKAKYIVDSTMNSLN